VIQLEPWLCTVFQAFSEVVHSFFCTMFCLQHGKKTWVEQQQKIQTHINALETLSGTPYRQQFFYRNGVPGPAEKNMSTLRPQEISSVFTTFLKARREQPPLPSEICCLVERWKIVAAWTTGVQPELKFQAPGI